MSPSGGCGRENEGKEDEVRGELGHRLLRVEQGLTLAFGRIAVLMKDVHGQMSPFVELD